MLKRIEGLVARNLRSIGIKRRVKEVKEMNKKNTLILLFAAALCLAFLIPSASADRYRHNSRFVVVYGYPQTYYFGSYVFGWPAYCRPCYIHRHHPRYRHHIDHRPPHHKHPRHRDDGYKRGYRHR